MYVSLQWQNLLTWLKFKTGIPSQIPHHKQFSHCPLHGILVWLRTCMAVINSLSNVTKQCIYVLHLHMYTNVESCVMPGRLRLQRNNYNWYKIMEYKLKSYNYINFLFIYKFIFILYNNSSGLRSSNLTFILLICMQGLHYISFWFIKK